MSTVLHVSPHPDDEALGAPATLLMLRDTGWTVVNVVARLGGADQQARRRDEARAAAERAGFELVLPDEREFADRLTALVEERSPELVVSPWRKDSHPRHEEVARVVGDVLATRSAPPVWWQWGLWADLPSPTLYVPFDDAVLAEAQHVLAAYAGELARNDYARLLEARAVAHAVLGSERVFGFGSGRASPLPYAELLVEQRCVDGEWRTDAPRVFTPAEPLRR